LLKATLRIVPPGVWRAAAAHGLRRLSTILDRATSDGG